ncbi:hypothetical protein GBZ48_31550 [Azospirillum melinis]|uniref:Uncharacterized protein n=1 Tax=Azospirillum melinis TaxID=328839 RepID=A0ABX2KJG8_9PROT|nr:hypothetical protein [Azospirillum melinis]MBP2310487.1 hypothetical protein [Azospirillum melinis]NUB03753.1 hypothetical protein [Azospirillum melinis]
MDIDQLESEILTAAEHVPFGNSCFQIAAFTGGTEGGPTTPARRVRSLLLNLDSKIQALREAQYKREESVIDMDEADAKLAKGDLDEFDARRMQLQRTRAANNIQRDDKLLRDCMIEIQAMYAEWKSLPPVTSREQFEQQELGYWINRLAGNATLQIKASGRIDFGTLEALKQIGVTDAADTAGGLQLAGPAIETYQRQIGGR